MFFQRLFETKCFIGDTIVGLCDNRQSFLLVLIRELTKGFGPVGKLLYKPQADFLIVEFVTDGRDVALLSTLVMELSA
jgi:hypothetical protein